MRTRFGLALLIGFFAAGCATVHVSVDYDNQQDLSRFKSFALLPDPPGTGNLRADNPLLQKRIRSAIADQLEFQGFASAAKPQMLVGYHASTSEKLEVRTIQGGYSHWHRGGAMGHETEVRQYEEGTLVIDIVDAERNTLVWRGSASLRLRQSPTPEQITERVRAVVAEILERFPPASDA